MFSRILIANRGEIAIRIIRAARELGVESVAIYSEADANSMHVKLADRAICVGPPAATESYLNIPRIIAAAEIANVDAIHPGYGFLAENSHFAEVCRSCNIEFIGPPVDAMETLGNKVKCKQLAVKNKVPTSPGSKGKIEDEEAALKVAREIGYPVMIKASAGGGGRGMRVANNDISLRAGLKAAQAEAQAAFGDGSVYVEKFIDRARHVEVQVLGDSHGNVVHLWERDCTMQRRKQKLIEEAPCPVLTRDAADKLCKSAARLVAAAGYYSAATVEFLMDSKNDMYLMEVNTRVQVEHPVTEMITGVDIVKEQIRIAAGEKLSFTQKDIKIKGHAIEARINAEDPDRNFAPCAGPIDELYLPGGLGVRVDTHVYAGYRVPPNYDSMIAKLIVHADDRNTAISRLSRSLAEFKVGPIATTVGLHSRLMKNGNFRKSDIDINFVERLLGL
ncbi:acetyl-CoA carboxylase biotin carboxylase subunit [Mucisphaera calidilacus]|uniref:Biotin carboxylase n=1 Tax=Mucisphaera calidilacus TaxID=2527982 RepID=A0A518BY65_9BACT|nr:acetyl-CoA carboxylase biotin carboxylase subunit [Mucisphaera calidilacus]QDU71896.1 Biotin carboxylase [Mucisphaera calidilacus]